jgi:phosphoserine phosphatase
LAYNLEFFEGKTTGEVNPPYYFFGSPESICGHSFCKTNALQYACEKYICAFKNCIVVGDSIDDRCMVGHAGKGVAFCTNDELLEKMAVQIDQRKKF